MPDHWSQLASLQQRLESCRSASREFAIDEQVESELARLVSLACEVAKLERESIEL